MQGFANGDNLAQAWADLSSENKTLLLATIMGFQPNTMPAPAQMQQMMQQMMMGMGGMGMSLGGGGGAGAAAGMQQMAAAAAAAGMSPAQMAQQMAAQAGGGGGGMMMRPGMMTPQQQQMQAFGAAQGQGQGQGYGGPSMPMPGMAAGTPMHHPTAAAMMAHGGGGAQSPMMMMTNANGHAAAAGENGYNDEIKCAFASRFLFFFFLGAHPVIGTQSKESWLTLTDPTRPDPTPDSPIAESGAGTPARFPAGAEDDFQSGDVAGFVPVRDGNL